MAGDVLKRESRPDETLLDGVSGRSEAGMSRLFDACDEPKLYLERYESASARADRLERPFATAERPTLPVLVP